MKFAFNQALSQMRGLKKALSDEQEQRVAEAILSHLEAHNGGPFGEFFLLSPDLVGPSLFTVGVHPAFCWGGAAAAVVHADWAQLLTAS
jgi:hypothetical protein